MNKTLLKTTNNKNYNFKKDLSLHLKSSREPASTTLLGNGLMRLLKVAEHSFAGGQRQLA